MNKTAFLPLTALLLMMPGDLAGFPHGGGARPAPVTPAFHAAPARPAPAYHPAPVARPAPVVHAAPAYHPAPVARPAPAARPAFVPHQPAATVNRPAAAGAAVNRPAVTGNTINRTTVNRTTVNRATVNRAAVSGNTFNRANVGSVNRNTVNVNRGLVGSGVNISRGNGFYRPGYSNYHNYYGGWHHGYWNSWNYRPWLWGGAGLASGWLLGSLTPDVVYANPYYVAPADTVAPVYDYAQPIAVPEPVEVAVGDDGTTGAEAIGQPTNQPDDAAAAAAAALLNDARDAFIKKDYDKAQELIDKAVSTNPKDTTLHEFRALVFFARGRYQEAAAAIYAVLAVGPGWDWDTLRSLYPDVQTYTDQLRALENASKADPTSAADRFLLAYHYLVLDERQAAAKMLNSVVALQPKNELAAYLLKSLANPPAPIQPQPPM